MMSRPIPLTSQIIAGCSEGRQLKLSEITDILSSPNVAFSMIPSLWKHTPSILVPTEFYFYSSVLNQTDFALSGTTGKKSVWIENTGINSFCSSQLSAGISTSRGQGSIKHQTIYKIDSMTNINNIDQKCQYYWGLRNPCLCCWGKILKFLSWNFPNCPVVKATLSLQGAWVWPLVGELRSCKLCGVVQK